jgi:hypothetical protein
MLIHGFNKGIFDIDIQAIRDRYAPTDFLSSAWLPLYEIERRNWDRSPSFRKMGTANDPDDLYNKLNEKNVEFYITRPSAFEVSAFEGWQLTQADFDHTRPEREAKMNWAMHSEAENYG